jgi:uncharacterized protein (TIGR02147 family)
MAKPSSPARTGRASTQISVFQYLDAREFLENLYAQEKRTNPAMSHRFIAKAMNARSSSFFRDVLSARIRLSPARARAFSKLFKLDAQEAEYFDNLVLYTQSETHEEKKQWLKKLVKDLPPGSRTLLKSFQMEYFKKWYYAAVRELFALEDFAGDPERLARTLKPAIRPSEARDAINLLLKLKLIRKTAGGGYRKVDPVVSSGYTADPAAMRGVIAENLDLGRRALDAYPAKSRPFSYLTLSVSEESFLLIRDKIRSFRKELLEIATESGQADRLYQMNLQFFPISETVKRSKKK